MFLRIKMKSLTAVALIISSVLLSSQAQADSANGVAIKAGSAGAGIEYYTGISDNVNLRFGINGFNYDDDFTENDITYEAEIQLRSASVVFDYHPWDSSSFRLSAGAYYNGNKVNAAAQAIDGEYEFNGDVYQVEDVASADGKIEFKKVAPYIGFGWSASPTSTSSWAFNLDIGAFYQDTPESQLNVTCGAALEQTLCDQLLADVRIEQDKLEEDIQEYKWYPVVTLGVLYRF